MTLFNTAEIPVELQQAWRGYVDMLVASPKNSILYYWTEENRAIPWWTLRNSLQKVSSSAATLWDTVWQQIATHLDRRRPVCLAVDDYVARRYGQQAYLADYFYSNAHGGVVWGNALVDLAIRHGNLWCPVTFTFHKRKGSLTLWERGLAQVQAVRRQLLSMGVRSDRLWTLGDCTYGNAAMAAELQPKEGFYLLSIPKSRRVELFGRSNRMEEYFASLPERRLTVAGKQYSYKLSTANLKDWGRQRLLAVRWAKRKWRYFASNNLKATAKTLLLRMRERWTVDDNHRNLKQFHGAEHFHVWTKESVLGHFHLVYVSGAVAGLERARRRREGAECTWEQMHREAIRWSRRHGVSPDSGQIGGAS